MAGLYLDGWAHVHLHRLDTFFTPWHAVFYSGFSAAAGWLAVSVQALLSPTHLILATALVLVASGPLCAAWARDEGPPSWGRLGPALLSLA